MLTWLTGLLLLVLLAVAGICGLGIYVGLRLLHPPRKPIDMQVTKYGIDQYESIQFPSRDGLTMSGWYFSAQANGVKSNRYTIIFAHGYSQNRLEPNLPALSLASKLVDAGYDILMFDFRNAGESEGKMSSVGLYEQRDLLGAVDYVSKHLPEHRIGLIGFSMGAATSLLVAGQDERIAAVVADSPFYSLYEYLQENLPVWTGLPAIPFNWVILTTIPLFIRANPRVVRPCDAVKRFAPKPMLFIHGTGDKTVPSRHSERLYREVSSENAELWLIPDADHVRGYAKEPKHYTRRVIQFFERHR